MEFPDWLFTRHPVMVDPSDTEDLAALYPAEFELWRDRPTVTSRQAVLLSLNIDPDSVDAAIALDATSHDWTAAASHESFSPHYGQQHADYLRRTEAIPPSG
jgi:hypothetical protein